MSSKNNQKSRKHDAALTAALTDVFVTLFNTLPPHERAKLRADLGLSLRKYPRQRLGRRLNRFD